MFHHCELTGTCVLRSCRSGCDSKARTAEEDANSARRARSRTRSVNLPGKSTEVVIDGERTVRGFPSDKFRKWVRCLLRVPRSTQVNAVNCRQRAKERKELVVSLRETVTAHVRSDQKVRGSVWKPINGTPAWTMHPPADNAGLKHTQRVDKLDQGNSGLPPACTPASRS